MNLKNQEIATDPLCVYICMGYGMCAGEGGGGGSCPAILLQSRSVSLISLPDLSLCHLSWERGREDMRCGFLKVCLWTPSEGRKDIDIS